jgi:hypothetical protein
MKYILRQKSVTAVQWKGWPHKIKGLEQHPKYPQLAFFNALEVYKGDWIITHPSGDKGVMDDYNFHKTYLAVG